MDVSAISTSRKDDFYDDDDLYASASSSTKKSVCNYCRQPGHFKDACKKLLDKIARNGGVDPKAKATHH